jgi:hypothetical protein
MAPFHAGAKVQSHPEIVGTCFFVHGRPRSAGADQILVIEAAAITPFWTDQLGLPHRQANELALGPSRKNQTGHPTTDCRH